MVWRRLAFQDRQVTRIASGKETSRAVLINAWNIYHALSIKSDGNLERWKSTLADYPDNLASNIVNQIAAFWRLPHRLDMLWTLAERSNLLSLNEWIAADVEDSLRILFAVNHMWEPDWKNLSASLALLKRKPQAVEQRIHEIYSAEDLSLRVRQSLSLILEVLELVPPECDVDLAKCNIHKILQRASIS